MRTSPDEVREKLKAKGTPMKVIESSIKRVVKHNKSNSLAPVIVNNTASLSIRETVKNERETTSLNTSIR